MQIPQHSSALMPAQAQSVAGAPGPYKGGDVRNSHGTRAVISMIFDAF